MLKKLFVSVASLAMIAQPITPSAVLADSGSWSYIQATAAWSYDDFKVERLDFDANTMGPLSIGDNVIIVEPAAICEPNSCARYDLYILKDGMGMFVGNVPIEVVNEQRYFNSDNEFIYVDSADSEDNNYWSVVKIDLDTGEETIIAENIFIDGVQDIDVVVREDEIYFTVSLNWDGHRGYSNAVIYVFDPLSSSVKVATKNWQQNNDDLQDAQNGVLLSKMTFSSGERQLWTYDTNVYPVNAEAVADTWTPENENIVGAHFRADATIEFFDMYQRYIYDGENSVAQGDYLSWYKSYEESMQVVDGRMAWLDPENVLRVSGADVNLELGKVNDPETFYLTPETIFYPTVDGGEKYDFASQTYTEYPFNVTDVYGEIVVGQDINGAIWYMNTETEKSIEIGSGTNAVISDEMHVYWRGTDEHVYEATMSLNALSGASDIRAVKVSGDSRVYLVLDNKTYWIQSDKVYFSWFESWDDVSTISSSKFSEYDYSGDAFYAPGTKLKLADDPKVYMVGSDGKLHWITTELLAYNIYGPTWNQDIIEFDNQETTGLIFSSPITNENGVQNI